VINIQNVKNKKNKFCFKKNVKKKKENLVFFNIKKTLKITILPPPQ
jgi:hypothetical protein